MFMVCSGIPHTSPKVFLVDDLFIRNNKDAFIEAAIDASTCIILGVYGEYKRLVARNGLNGVLEKHDHSCNKVRKIFPQSLYDEFADIQQKVDELYYHQEPKRMRSGLSSLSDDLCDTLKRSEYQRDQNPKILRSLISHHTIINFLKGMLDGIIQLFQKAASTRKIDHVHAMYDSLDCLQKMIQAHIRLLVRGLQYINQKETSTLATSEYTPPFDDRVSDRANDVFNASPLDIDSVKPYRSPEERVADISLSSWN